MHDEQLVRKAQEGDPGALETLCKREWRPVFALLYRSLQDRAEAEDATQDVFLRALRSFDHYRDQGTPIRAWLKTIARNMLRDRWRQRAPNLTDLDTQPEPADDDPLPDEHALAADRRAMVDSLLDSLNEDQRQVIRLRILEGRPTDEVAAMMNRTPNAIRQLQFRALSTLRARMQEGSTV